jgi:hypothetical protein
MNIGNQVVHIYLRSDLTFNNAWSKHMDNIQIR